MIIIFLIFFFIQGPQTRVYSEKYNFNQKYKLEPKMISHNLTFPALPFPSPVVPNPGIEPKSLAWQVDSLPSELPGKLSLSKIM